MVVCVLVKVVVVVEVWVLVIVVLASGIATINVVVVDAVAELVGVEVVTVFVFLAVTVKVRGMIDSTSTWQITFEGYFFGDDPTQRELGVTARTTTAPPCLTAGSRSRALRPPFVGVG